MTPLKVRKLIKKHGRMGMKAKLYCSFGAIAVVLLASSLISVWQYKKMSNYMSSLISQDVNCINMAKQLSDLANEYNLDILALIGDGSLKTLPPFDAGGFVDRCDSLRNVISTNSFLPLADSVEQSYSAYMLTSLELQEVVESDFIDTHEWYFNRLQPFYNRLRSDLEALVDSLYSHLDKHSKDFDSGFYRSIIPSSLSVAVALLLVLMLMFFIISYYVKPIDSMSKALRSYRSFNRQYNVNFEGDDQLSAINEGVKELCEENSQLRKRILQSRKDNNAS